MKAPAVLERDSAVDVVDIPDREPGPGEARVAVAAFSAGKLGKIVVTP